MVIKCMHIFCMVRNSECEYEYVCSIVVNVVRTDVYNVEVCVCVCMSGM